MVEHNLWFSLLAGRIMRILALDFSTSTGYAVLEKDEGKDPVLVSYGVIKLPKPILAYGEYPFSYYKAAESLIEMTKELLAEHNPDVVVVEETNLGKSRYSQKALEFFHCLFSQTMCYRAQQTSVIYLSSSAWRQALGLQLSKEEKKANAKLAKAKREATEKGEKLDKKTIGIKGKITKKHVAINYVNQRLGLELKAKHDDIADAICLALAFLSGASACDGT